MKKLFILAFTTLIGGTAFAQTESASGTTPRPLKFGLKAGVNLPKYHFADNDEANDAMKTTTNFHVTGFLDAPLSKAFSIQPGLSLQGKGGKTEGTIAGVQTTAEQNTMWLEVPINVVGKVPLGATGSHIFLGAGPYAGFGLSGENKASAGSVTNKTDVNFGKDSGDDLKSMDFGVNFLGGVQLGNGFNVGAGYGLGLTDLRPNGDGDEGQMTNRVLSFSVGFAF